MMYGSARLAALMVDIYGSSNKNKSSAEPFEIPFLQ